MFGIWILVCLGRTAWRLLPLPCALCSTDDCPVCEVPKDDLDRTDHLYTLLSGLAWGTSSVPHRPVWGVCFAFILVHVHAGSAWVGAVQMGQAARRSKASGCCGAAQWQPPSCPCAERILSQACPHIILHSLRWLSVETWAITVQIFVPVREICWDVLDMAYDFILRPMI